MSTSRLFFFSCTNLQGHEPLIRLTMDPRPERVHIGDVQPRLERFYFGCPLGRVPSLSRLLRHRVGKISVAWRGGFSLARWSGSRNGFAMRGLVQVFVCVCDVSCLLYAVIVAVPCCTTKTATRTRAAACSAFGHVSSSWHRISAYMLSRGLA